MYTNKKRNQIVYILIAISIIFGSVQFSLVENLFCLFAKRGICCSIAPILKKHILLECFGFGGHTQIIDASRQLERTLIMMIIINYLYSVVVFGGIFIFFIYLCTFKKSAHFGFWPISKGKRFLSRNIFKMFVGTRTKSTSAIWPMAL